MALLGKRIFVAKFLEVLLHDWVIRRICRTELVSFEAVDNGLVVVHNGETSVLLRRLCPSNKFIPIAAFHNLAFPHAVLHHTDWHRGIVGSAHYILSDSVEAMIHVTWANVLVISTFVVDECTA